MFVEKENNLAVSIRMCKADYYQIINFIMDNHNEKDVPDAVKSLVHLPNVQKGLFEDISKALKQKT